jgi:hypothetical protein
MGSFMQPSKSDKHSTGKAEAQKILSTVPYERGFHFFTDVGKYTGETAVNLFSLYEELRTIEGQSVKFHLQRGDFQNWIRNTLGDTELAQKIDKIRPDLPSEDLKKELRKTVMERLEELTNVTKSP